MFFNNNFESIKSNKLIYIEGYHSSEFLLNLFDKEIQENNFICLNFIFENNFYQISNEEEVSVFNKIIDLNIEFKNNICFKENNQEKIINILKYLKPIEKSKIIAIKIEEEINNNFFEVIEELNNKNYNVVIFSEKKYIIEVNYNICVKEKSIKKQGCEYNQVFICNIYFKNIESKNKIFKCKSLKKSKNKAIKDLYESLEKEVYKKILINF